MQQVRKWEVREVRMQVRRLLLVFARVVVGPGARGIQALAALLDHANAWLSEPYYRYQPNPGRKNARRRASSTRSRLDAIEADIPKAAHNVLDIGCNTGFMAVELSEGRLVLGTEASGALVSTAQHSARALGCRTVTFMQHVLTPESVKQLPTFDVVLFLGVWHHLPKTHSLEDSVGILADIWRRTNMVLYFEAGYGPVESVRHHLGLNSATGDTLSVYEYLLNFTCPGGTISEIGQFTEGESRTDSRLSVRPVYSVKRAATRLPENPGHPIQGKTHG